MKTKQKAIVGNTFYTIAAALILNGVLQILIYPRLNADMGSEVIGGVLYITGLVSILGPSIGQALNTGRLVVRRDYDVSNGDYNRIILLFSAIGIAIALLISRKSLDGPMVYAATAVLLLITIFRYYGDTEYRLSLNYKGYLIYYVLISVGYIVGYVVFRLGGSWFWIFLIGEIAGIVYLAAKGSIFHNFWKTSPNHNIVLQKGALLVMSYFITNTTLN
ncbi:MAG: hypothetical protein KBS83_09040, partial [Lachnospiraceae bacterium]|nr:hypothetical protein [Candidatus Equihabitans merdae]